MRKTDIYEIAIKMMGVYLAVLFINSVFNSINLIAMFSSLGEHTQSNVGVIVGSLPSPLIMLAVAIIFVFKTDKIVSVIAKKDNEIITASIDRATIYEIALILTGSIIFVWSLPDLGLNIYNYFHFERDGIQLPKKNQHLVLNLIKVFIGIIVVLAANPLSRIFSKEKQ